MYGLSSKLDLSINTKFPISKTSLIFLVDFSTIPIVIIIDFKKPKIKDRKITINFKGELVVEINIMMEMSFIF